MKPRKMLNNWEAPCIQSLIKIIPTQSKTTLAHWAIDYAEEHLIPIWNKYYAQDERPFLALEKARLWLAGQLKLPQVKPAILNCHEAAQEAAQHPIALAAARAIGQCASTIHSARHCIGLVLYGALAIAYEQKGVDTKWEELEDFANKECVKMEKALQRIAVVNETNPSNIDWKC